MIPRLIQNPHVKRMSGSFEIVSGGDLIRVITVETDLALSAADPAYNSSAVDELLAALQESMGDLYDRADLKQALDA
jgi:hypothetical protein